MGGKQSDTNLMNKNLEVISQQLTELTNKVNEIEMRGSNLDSLFLFLEKNQWVSVSVVVFCFGLAFFCFRMYDRAVLKQHLKYIESAIRFNHDREKDLFVSKIDMNHTGTRFEFSLRPKQGGPAETSSVDPGSSTPQQKGKEAPS